MIPQQISINEWVFVAAVALACGYVGWRHGLTVALYMLVALGIGLLFADRIAKEIMVPRTRMVAIDRAAPPDELFRIVTENPFSRMPVYEGSVDDIVGILLVREFIGEGRRGGGQPFAVDRYL